MYAWPPRAARVAASPSGQTGLRVGWWVSTCLLWPGNAPGCAALAWEKRWHGQGAGVGWHKVPGRGFPGAEQEVTVPCPQAWGRQGEVRGCGSLPPH